MMNADILSCLAHRSYTSAAALRLVGDHVAARISRWGSSWTRTLILTLGSDIVSLFSALLGWLLIRCARPYQVGSDIRGGTAKISRTSRAQSAPYFLLPDRTELTHSDFKPWSFCLSPSSRVFCPFLR